MTAPNREQFKNDSATTLNGAITNTATSIVVTTGSVLPSVGNFRIKIDSEILLCTARSTNTLTVARGQEGTTAASHSDLAAVTHVLTKESIDRHGKDNVNLWGQAPALHRIMADDGITALVASDFTWRNQGGAARTDEAGTIRMTVPVHSGASYNARILERVAPATPYSYQAAFSVVMPPSQAAGTFNDIKFFGLGFVESGSGIITTIHGMNSVSISNGMGVASWASVTTQPVAHIVSASFLHVGSLVWFKIEDDGTNLKYYVGDGLAWLLVTSHGRTSEMSGGPDRVCFFANHFSTDIETFVRLVHWSRAS